jgi:hypothetical protein
MAEQLALPGRRARSEQGKRLEARRLLGVRHAPMGSRQHALRRCRLDTAIEIQKQLQGDFFGVETNQLQEFLADDIVRRGQERGVKPPVFMFDNTVPKAVRTRRLTPLLSQRRLRFKTGSKVAKLLVEQLRDFPCGEIDDGPDCCEMAARLASEALANLFEQPWEPPPLPIEFR